MNCFLRLNKDLTGQKIKQHIIRSGMTYDQVADEIGLASSRVIYDWTNGLKMPSIENLVRFSRTVDTVIEDILVIENIF